MNKKFSLKSVYDMRFIDLEKEKMECEVNEEI